MSSPFVQQLFRKIKIKRAVKKPVYLQLSDAVMLMIKEGRLNRGDEIPGSREIAQLLKINRVTVTRALDDLHAQGWLNRLVGKGTFVAEHIPEISPDMRHPAQSPEKMAGFPIPVMDYINHQLNIPNTTLHLDDGFPDPHLAPLKELYRSYRAQLTRGGIYDKFGRYNYPEGAIYYTQALSAYLNHTRGLNTTSDNLLSIRGTIMGINLVCNGLISPGEVIVSGIPGKIRAEDIFVHYRAKHIGIPVDRHGIVVEALAEICRKTRVRMVYVTPYHHYPTTVTLSVERRTQLLQLAEEYRFIIFEDENDFDFHYQRRPLFPLAAADKHGMVIHCGSFSKSFSPAFRIGYLVASKNVIDHLSQVRLLLDRQGDQILEYAMAELLREGTAQRYLRKAMTVYQTRRDFFCEKLTEQLGDSIRYDIPEGGLTVWARFDKAINLEKLAQKALRRDLYLSDGNLHKYPAFNENATRLGFGSSTIDQLEKSIGVLKKII